MKEEEEERIEGYVRLGQNVDRSRCVGQFNVEGRGGWGWGREHTLVSWMPLNSP